MPDRPLIIFVASYADVAGAEADYDAVRALHKAGDLGHVAAAVVTKGTDGKLKIHRHDTTAKHLAWGGALVGGLIGVLVPPLGFAWLAGAAIDGVVLAGAGGVVGHYWHNIPKADLQEMSDLLDAGEAGLVVVAVDKIEEEIEAVVVHAVRKVTKKLEKGDVEGAYTEAAKAAAEVDAITES
jgi:uncharacterized membrane protein